MTRYFLIFILIFRFAGQSEAQPTAGTYPSEVGQPITGFFDALAALDIEKARSFCAPNIILLENGKVWTMDSLALRMQAMKAKSADFNRINKIDFIDTKISGDIAWVSYYNQATIRLTTKTAKVKWLESVVLKKVQGKWEICLLHSTELERGQ